MTKQRTDQRPCKKHKQYPILGCPLCMQEIDGAIRKQSKWE